MNLNPNINLNVKETLRTVLITGIVLLFDYQLAREKVDYTPSILASLIVVTLAIQVGLASVWLALGRDPVVLRIAGFAPVALAVRVFLDTWFPIATNEFGPCFWMQGVIITGMLMLVRARRFQVMRVDKAAMPESLGPPQYSLRGILIVTTLISAALAMLVPLASMSIILHTQIISCVVGIFLAGLTLISVFSTLVLRRALVSAAFTCAASLLLGWSIGKAMRYDAALTTLAFGGPIIIQVAVLLAWRAAGYRLVRVESEPKIEPQASVTPSES